MNTTAPNWSDKTILIVEDIDSSRRYFEAALKLTNANLLYAHNGQQAIEALKNSETIDLVLLDIYLPLLSGIDVLKHIRKTNPTIPIIVQTAYTGYHNEKEALQAGANVFLTKPVSLTSLYKEIEQLLSI
ncbi:MAG: response regulator [Bacteroidales bacterium]|jgi:CheY-like chemotaxis protein|nr:response regulator [Bacteroidales bacterium]